MAALFSNKKTRRSGFLFFFKSLERTHNTFDGIEEYDGQESTHW